MMELNSIKKEIETLLLGNYRCVQEKGYSGYDPQVYWYLYFTRRAKNNPSFLNRVFRKIEIKIIDTFPRLLFPYLKLLKIDGIELVPYGLGLFIQAYVNMYKYFNDEKYLEEAKKVAGILEEMLVKLPNGLGAPNSKKTASLKFNNGITSNETVYLPSSAEVFEGFYKLYLLTSNQVYLKIIKAMASSFIKDHKVKKFDDNRLVLNYSSVADDTHILNANALAAGCLSKLDEIQNTEEYYEEIKGIYGYLKYYIDNYKYLPYAGEEDSKNNKFWKTCDTYHTGFTLRGMLQISKNINKDSGVVYDKMKSMLKDFVDEENRVIRVIGQRNNKQDVHALAEFIHVFAICYEKLSDIEKQKCLKVCMKNISNFSDQGTYFYTVENNKKNSIYMPRWAQAPMMNALSLLLIKMKN